MTLLSSFSLSEAELLVSLPYKVGVWVSHADDEEGERDDALEMKALETCIKAIAKLHEDQPFIKDVSRETLRQKDLWPEWTDQSFNALRDGEQAMALLAGKASQDDRKNYKAVILEIATTVAQAFGEFGSFDDGDDEGSLFGGIVGKIVGGFSSLSQSDAGHPMNISPAEDSAISRLAQALGTDDE